MDETKNSKRQTPQRKRLLIAIKSISKWVLEQAKRYRKEKVGESREEQMNAYFGCGKFSLKENTACWKSSNIA